MRKLVLLIAVLSMVVSACGVSAEEEVAQARAEAITADFDLRLQAIQGTDDWCEIVDLLADVNSGLDLVDPTDSVALEAAYSSSSDVLAAATAKAPAEISNDMSVTAQGFDLIADALSDADWIFARADFVTDALEQDDVDLASYNIASYNFTECGIGEDPGEPPVATDE